MSLAENIYRFRTEQNMSQLDLADALEVSRQSVSKWETGTAVPELDKLIKMSDLFDVSLDVLVGRAVPAATAPAQPTLRWLSSIPTRKLVGGILFICAFLFFLAFIIKNSIWEGFLFTLPLVGCGLVCFFCPRHTGLWCAWMLCAPFLLMPMEQYIRIDIASLIDLFTQIPLLAFTVLSFRKEKLEMNRFLHYFLGAGWISWFFWLLIWLGGMNRQPVLFEGLSLPYLVDTLLFPLFTVLLTTTVRVWKPKERTI